jgi:pilus retraction protein PilT
MIFDEWIEQAYALGASDLHLEAGTPVIVRVRGELQSVGGIVTGDALLQVGQDLLGTEGWREFKERGSADLSADIGGIRCRANLFRTVRGMAVAVRLLSPGVKDLRACNLHPDFRRFIEASSGLIIISGPTGSGKSTTLAALIEEINATRARNIVVLESPIEYVFTNRQSFVRQREIPTHSPSFEQGIVDALRENPDVLVISEMRTPEVMRLTLNAAETGHLVLATMHSATCTEALTRVCMSFPSDLQERAGAARRLPGGRILPAAGISRRSPLARASLRNPASDLRSQGHHPGRKLQPARERAAVRRRGGHVDVRPLPALDGTSERLGAAACGRRGRTEPQTHKADAGQAGAACPRADTRPIDCDARRCARVAREASGR